MVSTFDHATSVLKKDKRAGIELQHDSNFGY
jgi:hypothetical protein